VILVLAIGVVGGLAAIARVLVTRAVSLHWRGQLPLGTLVVNLSGATLLGLLAGLASGDDLTRVAGVGALGSFTTFSTWMFESERLAEDGAHRALALNLVVSLAAGLLAVWLGRELGQLL
jgi:CrcB protein